MAAQHDHTRAVDLISAYIDKQVTAQEQQFMERHLRACADCRAQLEATRTMIAALHAMPALKAPRSFVLPREMARQPKRSILAWYPALRLATAVAVVAFIVVFAGDVLTSRSSNRTAPMLIPAAAPQIVTKEVVVTREVALAVQTETSAAQDTARSAAPTAAAEATALPQEAAAPAAPAEVPPAAPQAGMAAAQPTAIMPEVSAKVPAPTEPLMPTTEAAMEKAIALTPVPEVTTSVAAGGAANQANAPLADTATPAPTFEPERQATAEAAANPIDPLRVIEIGLLGLIVVLGAATLIARRSA